MRKTSLVLVATLLCLTQAASALPEISVTAPNPTFPSGVVPGASTTAVFQITNNTHHGWPLNLYGFSAPFTRVPVSRDCVSSIPSGPNGICFFGIAITPSSGGTVVNQTLYLDYQGRVPTVVPISATVLNPPSVIPVAVAVGGTFNGSAEGPPLIVNSTDNAATFTTQTTTSLAAVGALSFIGCSAGQSAGSACIAAGTAFVSGVPATLVVNSTNGGSSFTSASVAGITTNDTLHGGACSGAGSTAVCILGGTASDTGSVYLMSSQDGGATFTGPVINGTVNFGVFNGVDCANSTGTGTGLCIAVGQDSSTQLPLIVTSSNGGQSFTQAVLAGDVGELFGASCSGSLCVAAGVDTFTSFPLQFLSIDGGSSFTSSSFPTTPGQYNAVSCSKTASSGICISVGGATGGAPLIYATEDGGASFTAPALTGATTGNLLSASCSANGSIGFCAVGGSDTSISPAGPLLGSSIDSATTFQLVTIPGITGQAGQINSVSCSGLAGNGICLAAGFQGTGSSTSRTPLLIVSTDGANTWHVVAVNNVTNGFFSDVGSSSVAGFAPFLKSHLHKEFNNPNHILKNLLSHDA